MCCWCAVSRQELEKAKDVLLQYEEELLQPSARTLRFMARSLQRADMPVPFDVPDYVAVRLHVWPLAFSVSVCGVGGWVGVGERM